MSSFPGRPLALAILVAATLAFVAQAQMTNQPGEQSPAARTQERQLPPLPGANSFTEEQARNRISTAGYSQVGQMKLDNQGIWRGTATKNGKEYRVALDYRGNIVEYE